MTEFVQPLSRREDGFTLVELLVVILIIAILAAAAIAAFLLQQDKANDSAAKQALEVAYKTAKSEAVFNDGTFPSETDLVAALHESEPQLNAAAIPSADDTVSDQLGVIESSGKDLDLAARSDSGALCRLIVENGVRRDGDPVCGAAADAGDEGDDGESPGGDDGGEDEGGDEEASTTLLYSVSTNGGFERELYRAQDDGSDPLQLGAIPPGESGAPTTIAFDASADGSKIAFFSARTSGYEALWVADADGSNADVLPNPCQGSGRIVSEATGLAVSPNGSTVYVPCTQSFNTSLWRVDVSTGNAAQMAAGDPALQAMGAIGVSPDGTTLAFTHFNVGGATSGLYTLPANDSAAPQLISTAPKDTETASTYLGSGRVAFWRKDDPWASALHLFSVDVSGGDLAAIEAGGEMAGSDMNGGPIASSGSSIAFKCINDFDSYSSNSRICVTRDGGPLEWFDAQGPVRDLDYLTS